MLREKAEERHNEMEATIEMLRQELQNEVGFFPNLSVVGLSSSKMLSRTKKALANFNVVCLLFGSETEQVRIFSTRPGQ